MVLSKEVGGRKRRRSEGDDVEDVGEVLRQVRRRLNESEEQHYFLLGKLGQSEERIMVLEEKEEERGEKKKKVKGYLPRDDEGAIFIAEFMREPVRKMVQRFPFREEEPKGYYNETERYLFRRLKELGYQCGICEKENKTGNIRSTHMAQIHKRSMYYYYDQILERYLKDFYGIPSEQEQYGGEEKQQKSEGDEENEKNGGGEENGDEKDEKNGGGEKNGDEKKEKNGDEINSDEGGEEKEKSHKNGCNEKFVQRCGCVCHGDQCNERDICVCNKNGCNDKYIERYVCVCVATWGVSVSTNGSVSVSWNTVAQKNVKSWTVEKEDESCSGVEVTCCPHCGLDFVLKVALAAHIAQSHGDAEGEVEDVEVEVDAEIHEEREEQQRGEENERDSEKEKNEESGKEGDSDIEDEDDADTCCPHCGVDFYLKVSLAAHIAQKHEDAGGEVEEEAEEGEAVVGQLVNSMLEEVIRRGRRRTNVALPTSEVGGIEVQAVDEEKEAGSWKLEAGSWKLAPRQSEELMRKEKEEAKKRSKKRGLNNCEFAKEDKYEGLQKCKKYCEIAEEVKYASSQRWKRYEAKHSQCQKCSKKCKEAVDKEEGAEEEIEIEIVGVKQNNLDNEDNETSEPRPDIDFTTLDVSDSDEEEANAGGEIETGSDVEHVEHEINEDTEGIKLHDDSLGQKPERTVWPWMNEGGDVNGLYARKRLKQAHVGTSEDPVEVEEDGAEGPKRKRRRVMEAAKAAEEAKAAAEAASAAEAARLEEEANAMAEAEATRLKEEEETRLKEEEETRLKEEEEAKAVAEAARLKEEEETRLKEEEEAKAVAEAAAAAEAAKERAEEDAKEKAEKKAMERAEEEAKEKLEKKQSHPMERSAGEEVLKRRVPKKVKVRVFENGREMFERRVAKRVKVDESIVGENQEEKDPEQNENEENREDEKDPEDENIVEETQEEKDPEQNENEENREDEKDPVQDQGDKGREEERRDHPDNDAKEEVSKSMDDPIENEEDNVEDESIEVESESIEVEMSEIEWFGLIAETEHDSESMQNVVEYGGGLEEEKLPQEDVKPNIKEENGVCGVLKQEMSSDDEDDYKALLRAKEEVERLEQKLGAKSGGRFKREVVKTELDIGNILEVEILEVKVMEGKAKTEEKKKEEEECDEGEVIVIDDD